MHRQAPKMPPLPKRMKCAPPGLPRRSPNRSPGQGTRQSPGQAPRPNRASLQLLQLCLCLLIFGVLAVAKLAWPQSAQAVRSFVKTNITDGLDVRAAFAALGGPAKVFGSAGQAVTAVSPTVTLSKTPVVPSPSAEPSATPGAAVSPKSTPKPSDPPAFQSAAVPVKPAGPMQINALAYESGAEDLDDTTWPLPFNMPKPDVVDFANYEATFPHKNPLATIRVTSPFGYRTHPVDGVYKFHYGVDLVAAEGTPIYAFAAGVVYEVGHNAMYGNYIRVRHANGFTTFYGHCSKIIAKDGRQVVMGQKLALSGATGNVTGPHLHFEIRHKGLILDPTKYLTNVQGKTT